MLFFLMCEVCKQCFWCDYLEVYVLVIWYVVEDWISVFKVFDLCQEGDGLFSVQFIVVWELNVIVSMVVKICCCFWYVVGVMCVFDVVVFFWWVFVGVDVFILCGGIQWVNCVCVVNSWWIKEN